MNHLSKFAAAVVLGSPAIAFASEGIPLGLYALGGGAVGGFFGALIACWLCKRLSSKKDKNSDR